MFCILNIATILSFVGAFVKTPRFMSSSTALQMSEFQRGNAFENNYNKDEIRVSKAEGQYGTLDARKIIENKHNPGADPRKSNPSGQFKGRESKLGEYAGPINGGTYASNIVGALGMLKSEGSFNTLLAAIKKADLEDILAGIGKICLQLIRCDSFIIVTLDYRLPFLVPK